MCLKDFDIRSKKKDSRSKLWDFCGNLFHIFLKTFAEVFDKSFDIAFVLNIPMTMKLRDTLIVDPIFKYLPNNKSPCDDENLLICSDSIENYRTPFICYIWAVFSISFFIF